MTGFQIAMIMIGIVCLIGSFFVSEKLSKADLEEMKKMSDEESKGNRKKQRCDNHTDAYASQIIFKLHVFVPRQTDLRPI